MTSRHTQSSLWELALLFLRLGVFSFGGPAAHIALMEEEFVRRRAWLTRAEFLDLLGATNLIPGPNSTELAIHIGYKRAGWRGLLIAGVSFILPAALIVLGLAWAYVRFQALPQLSGLLYGIKPVLIAIVLQALWSLSRTALKTRGLAVLGVAVVLAGLWGVHEIALLLSAGGLMFLLAPAADSDNKSSLAAVAVPLVLPAASYATAFNLQTLFFVFLKIGSVLFGSGYVLLAFLRADLVERYGWLTEAQLLDAVAVGQITPGPVLTTATFIGYLLGGVSGALVATVGIFLPAFVLVALSGPLVPRLRDSKRMGAFLNGVNVASLALLGVVTLQLGRAALIDGATGFLALVSLFLLLRYKLNSAWLILGGAVLGVALRF